MVLGACSLRAQNGRSIQWIPGRSWCRCRNPTSGTTWARASRPRGTAAPARGRARGPSRAPWEPATSPAGRSRTETMSPFFFASSSDCRPQARPTQTWASLHRADRPGLDQLDDPAVVVAGVDLRAHLGGDLGLRGRLADDPGLPDVVRQRLLAIDVLAQLQGGQGGEGVGVLGRAHDDRVELAGVVVELAEVATSSAPWDASRRPRRRAGS